jgi:hypothetical protein
MSHSAHEHLMLLFFSTLKLPGDKESLGHYCKRTDYNMTNLKSRI